MGFGEVKHPVPSHQPPAPQWRVTDERLVDSVGGASCLYHAHSVSAAPGILAMRLSSEHGRESDLSVVCKDCKGKYPAFTMAICDSPIRVTHDTMNVPLVCDYGSVFSKVGLSGTEAPLAMFPTILGKLRHDNPLVGMQEEDWFIRDEAQKKRGELNLQYPISRVTITNWDNMEKIWHHSFYQVLRIAPEQHPLMVTELPLNIISNKEKMSQILFETFNVPALYLANQGVLSLYASGQTSSDWEYIRDIKEKCCYVALDFDKEKLKADSPSYAQKYQLPDGQEITLGQEKFLCPKGLFQADIMGRNGPGIHMKAFQSISSCSSALWKVLFGHSVLSGGTGSWSGLRFRMQREISALVSPTVNVKVSTCPSPIYNAWLGGSILCSLSTFKDMFKFSTSPQLMQEATAALVESLAPAQPVSVHFSAGCSGIESCRDGLASGSVVRREEGGGAPVWPELAVGHRVQGASTSALLPPGAAHTSQQETGRHVPIRLSEPTVLQPVLSSPLGVTEPPPGPAPGSPEWPHVGPRHLPLGATREAHSSVRGDSAIMKTHGDQREGHVCILGGLSGLLAHVTDYHTVLQRLLCPPGLASTSSSAGLESGTSCASTCSGLAAAGPPAALLTPTLVPSPPFSTQPSFVKCKVTYSVCSGMLSSTRCQLPGGGPSRSHAQSQRQPRHPAQKARQVHSKCPRGDQ
ncbi:PREDICTED: uncharacterized protein LOC101384759 [Odobenus rosmarus divergens]|uniref:Uncharacterized protein LOC101384759 n=1 Tax=Odobenus rosmarus divergens TaxID=9708 RepID=A0A9B0G7M2_ODORO